MLKASKQASKPATTKTASSVLKNEKQKQKSTTTTATKHSNATDKNTDKKTIVRKSDNVVGLSGAVAAKHSNTKVVAKVPTKSTAVDKSKKNVMNTIHNVTVASPPPSAGKARSTSMINVRDFDEAKATNHSRSRTRTIAPEESVLHQRNLMSASLSHDNERNAIIATKQDPVAYEINFDDDKKAKKTIVKQKSMQEEKKPQKVSRQQSMIQDEQKKPQLKKQSSSTESTKTVVRQKSMIKDPKEQQSSSTESVKTVVKQKSMIKDLKEPKNSQTEAIKPLMRQKSMIKDQIKQQSSSTDSNKTVIRQKSIIKDQKEPKSSQNETTKTLMRQKSMIKDQIKSQNSSKKSIERQKTFVESDLSPSPPPAIEPQKDDEEENYESDFESYESDFETEPSEEPEQTTESEEESDNFVEQTVVQVDKVDKERIDSGSFDMSIKKSATPSAQYDSIDDTVNSHDSGISYEDVTALNKRLLSPKVHEFYKRGEELMKKITFDEITIDIFEQKPIQYEVFMSVYGQRGMTQASTQSDSNLISEEVQTESISKASAWTQYPAKFTRIGLEMINSKQYNEEKLGVGVEIFDFTEEKDKEDLDMSISAINNFSNDEDFVKIQPITNYITADLNRFIQNASITISNIIEGKTSNSRELAPSKISISRGFLQLKYREIEVLRNTIVTKIYTNLCLSNFLVTIHKDKSSNYHTLMCFWNILQTSRPLRVFCAWSDIKCLEIHPQQHDFIIGGCDDGTLCLWDTQETCEHLEVTYPCEVISLNQMRNNFSLDNVIALKSIPQRQFKSTTSMFSQSQAVQIASLHENGVMSVWTLLQIENIARDHEKNDMDFIFTGSKVKLIKNLSIDLTKFTKNNDDDEPSSKSARKKSAFDKTRYYFENDLFSDKVLRELQEIDTERLQKSKKLSFRDDTFTAISFDINFNELFVASDSNFIVALSRLCLGDKARKIITNESSSINPTVIKVHPLNRNILAIGQSDGSVKFVKTSDESSVNASKQRKQLKRSYATTGSNEENLLAKSCAFQNIVEREKKLYEETQALNNLESGELKAFMVNEELQTMLMENDEVLREKVKVAFDKNIFNYFEIFNGEVKAIEFSKNGELMFILINKSLKIFNCWLNAEIENHDNQKFIDIKCTHGSDGIEYLILLTTENEILVNKLKF